MKHKGLAALLAAGCLALLAGCAAPGGSPASASGAWDPCVPEEGAAAVTCRIVDGAADGALLLAGQGEDEGLYRLGVGETPLFLDDRPAAAADLADGMLVTVYFDGQVQESYPAGFSGVSEIRAQSQGADDRCGLVLEVFEELWNTDEGLNDGVVELGVDIDPTLVPNAAERAGIAWRFGELRGVQNPLQGTWEELAEQGYIQKEGLIWPDGCLFAFHAAENTQPAADRFEFDAQKWRSGLGAYFFQNCTARAAKGGAGGWTYEVGAHAIA